MVKITVKLPAAVFPMRGPRKKERGEGFQTQLYPTPQNIFELRVHYKITKNMPRTSPVQIK